MATARFQVLKARRTPQYRRGGHRVRGRVRPPAGGRSDDRTDNRDPGWSDGIGLWGDIYETQDVDEVARGRTKRPWSLARRRSLTSAPRREGQRQRFGPLECLAPRDRPEEPRGTSGRRHWRSIAFRQFPSWEFHRIPFAVEIKTWICSRLVKTGRARCPTSIPACLSHAGFRHSSTG